MMIGAIYGAVMFLQFLLRKIATMRPRREDPFQIRRQGNRVEHFGTANMVPPEPEDLTGVRDEDFVPASMKVEGVDKHGMTAIHNWYYTRKADIVNVYMGKLEHVESDETLIWMLYRGPRTADEHRNRWEANGKSDDINGKSDNEE